MTRLASFTLALVACSTPASVSSPDAAVPPPRLTGTYALRSDVELAAVVPGTAAAVLGELRAATDDADDPARFLVDKLIDSLPAGSVKTVARALSPFIAAYVEQRLADVAPRLIQ